MQSRRIAHPIKILIFMCFFTGLFALLSKPATAQVYKWTDENGKARAIRVKDVNTGESREIPCKGVFIAIGHIPNTDFIDGVLERDESGYIVPVSGSQVKTRHEGLFAAGDCVDHVYRQAITAAGMGCQAAIEAERYLAEL